MKTAYLFAIFHNEDGKVPTLQDFLVCSERHPTMEARRWPVLIVKESGADYTSARRKLYSFLSSSRKLSWILPILENAPVSSYKQFVRMEGRAFLSVRLRGKNADGSTRFLSLSVFSEFSPTCMSLDDHYIAIKSAGGKDYDEAHQKLLASLKDDPLLSWMNNLFASPSP